MGSYRFRWSKRAALLATCVALVGVAQPVWTGGASTAYAQGKPASKLTDAQKKAEAKRLFGDANNAYDNGDFIKAHRLFAEADMLVPGAVPKFRAAEALDKDGKVQEAITAYEAFLASNPPADKNQERIDGAKKRVQALKATPADVKLTITPAEAAGATVLVDGAQQTGTSFKVPPGKHTITVKAPGFEDATLELTFTFAEKRDIPVDLKKGSAAAVPPIVAPPPGGEPTSPPPEEEGGGSSKIPAYVTLGLSGAGFIVGTIFGISALSSKSDYEADPTQDSFDSTERNALIADMAFGASIAFGVTGVVLLLTADDGEEAAGLPSKSGASKSVASPRRGDFAKGESGNFIAPYVTPNGAGGAARVSF